MGTRPRACNSRQCEHIDARRPCPLQGPRTGLRGGAGGQNIIDQQDFLILHPAPRERLTRKAPCTLRRLPSAESPPWIGRRLDRLSTSTDSVTPRAGQRRCQPDRLVEAAADQPEIVQRHGHDQVGVRQQVLPGGRHPARQHVQAVAPPLVFQRQHQIAGDVAVFQRRAGRGYRPAGGRGRRRIPAPRPPRSRTACRSARRPGPDGSGASTRVRAPAGRARHLAAGDQGFLRPDQAGNRRNARCFARRALCAGRRAAT